MTRLLTLPFRLAWMPIAWFLRLLGFGAGVKRHSWKPPVADTEHHVWAVVQERREKQESEPVIRLRPDRGARRAVRARGALGGSTVLRSAGAKALVPIAAILAVAIATVGAFAYYTSSGTGTASASVGTLNPPTGVTVSPSGSTVTVSWAAPSGGVAPQGYYVQRYLGSTPSPACGTSPGALTTPSSAITCSDTGVAAGTYTYTVTAVYNSWTATSPASAPATVAGLATKLVFTTTAQTLTAGVTSGSIIVQREDASGNPTTSGALTLNLGTTSSGAVFRDTGDSTTITTVTIADTSSSASFKYKDTVSGAPTITASVTGGALTSATQTETVNAAAAVRLVFTTTAQTLTAGVTSGTITVQRQDSFNNPTSLGGALTVNLATSSAGGIFRDPGNTTTITSVQIASSANSASFLYKDTVSGSPTITASVTGGTPTSATQTETVKAAAASKLAFLTGPQTFLAGNAPSGGSGAISVQVQDSFGNPVVVTSNLPLTAASVPPAGVAFVTTQGGTTACGASGCFVPAGSSLGSFYMTDGSASSDSVTVTAGALTTPSQTYTVNAAAGSETVTVTYLSGALTPNGTANYTVTVTNNNNFGARSFQLAGVSGLPAGAVAAVLPSSCATNIAFHGTTSFPLSITASGGATPVGSFSFVVLVNASTTPTSCTTVNEHTQGSGVLNVTAAPATVSGLSPTSGPVGRTGVTINASGFITSHALTVTVGGTSAPITSGGTSDVNGNSTVTFTIPSLSVGSKAVVVSDGTNSATSGTNFTVTAPVLSGLSPTSGAVGTTGVTINASGFINSHALTVTVGGASASISSGGTTDATGSSTLTFTIPSLTAGSKAVVVSDGTNSATSGTNFTVTTPAVSGLSPTTGPVGTTGVTINASGFIASHSLTVTVGGASAVIASGGTTNAGGGSTVTFTIPALTAGSKTVTVSDGTNSINSATNFTVAPLITLAASGGSVGDTVTITGTGFAGSSTISTRTYDGAALTLTPTTPATSSSGGFSATFTVPASVAGVHTVLVKDASNNQATATFTVAPQITLAASSGVVGSTVTITGTGFAGSSTISTRTYDGAALTLTPTTPATSSSGGFSATFTVPASVAGVHTVLVKDASNNQDTATFTVTPQITLTPSTGNPGSTDSISGTGFAATSAISATYGGSSVTLSGTTTTGATGSFSAATFAVPASTAGTHAVAVTDGSSNIATSNFTVAPLITLAASGGSVGDTVTITGTGFAGSSTISTRTYDGAALTLTPTTPATSSSGGFSATFTVPASVAGVHTVLVKDASNNQATATFTVAPQITLAASSGVVGSTVTITGTGFAGSSTISTRTYDGAALTLTPTTPATSASGGFSATFTVPASVAGVHTVLVKDASNNQDTATFTVTPQITLTPSTGNPGSTDSISGTGFAATSAISATFNSSAVALGGTTTTGATGSFSAATYTVPSLTAAPYALAVTDASSNSGSATFTISAAQTITFVQQAVAGSGPANGETPTLTSPPANGHTLILLVGDDGSGSATVSGTPSGGGVTTWNRVTSVLGSGTPNAGEVEVWYGLVTCSPCNSGDEAVTVTMSHSTNIQFVNVSEWSGIATANPVDGTVANSATGTATSSGFTISTNGVLSQANELIITDGWVESAAFGFSTPQNASPGYTALSQTMAGGIVFRAFGAYQIDPTTTQISATWPENGSGSGAFYAAAIAAFKHQ